MENKFQNLLASDLFKEEHFVAEVQAKLAELMDSKGFSRAELARKLGVSRARVTQIFSDDAKNLTLRLLVRSYLALDEVPIVLSKSEYAVLCVANGSSRDARANRDCGDNELGAALIAKLLESAGVDGIEPERSARRLDASKIWAELGSNVIPLRGKAARYG